MLAFALLVRNDKSGLVILRRNPLGDFDVRIDRRRFYASAVCTAKTEE